MAANILFMRIADYLKLCRPQQWYKNLLVFLALFFSGNLLNIPLLSNSVIAFFILILVSSANYAINDVLDSKKDKHFAEKKSRPVASGRIKAWQAGIFAVVLILISFYFSFVLNLYFFFCVASIFLLTLVYSIFLKKIFLIDIATISANFVIRAVAGAFIIGVYVSNWLIAGIFLFALFLVAGKRYGELVLLGASAEGHRTVLHYYAKISKKLMYVFSILLIACFFIFLLFEHRILLFSSPLFVFLVIRYFQLAIRNPKIAASPNKAFSDSYLLFGSIIFIIISILLFYFI